MLLTEPIESINQQLIDLFGIDTITGMPIWRVVFSEDQYEKRFGTYDDYYGKIFIRTVTEVRLVPKYKQWIHEKYILERLVIIPVQQNNELPATQLSYEPIWTFQDKDENYLPPRLDACKFIIDTIYAVQHGSHMKRYVEPNELEEKEKRIKEIEEYLFGDESSLMYTTVTGESIIVPRNYEKEKKN